MVAFVVMAMVVSVSGLGVRALTSNRAGGVEGLSGGMGFVKCSAKHGNGAIRVFVMRDKTYQNTYQRAHAKLKCKLAVADGELERPSLGV